MRSRPNSVELRALALGELPREPRLDRRIARRLGLLAERQLGVVRGRLGLVARADGNARVGRELLEDVCAPRRIDQVGADHRVVVDLNAPAPVARRPWRPPPSALTSWATSGRPSRSPASAARSAASPVTTLAPSVAAKRPPWIASPIGALGEIGGRSLGRLELDRLVHRAARDRALVLLLEALDHGAQLELGRKVAEPREVGRRVLAIEEIVRHAHVELHRRQLLRDARVVGVVGQVLLALGAGDLVHRAEHCLERAELLQELRRGLVADAGDAGDVVRGVALEADQVGDQLGRNAVALDHAVRVIDLRVGHAARGRHHAGAVADELVDVAVARDDHHGPPPLLCLRRERGDHVVGLEALDVDVREAEGLGERLQMRPLLAKEVRARLAPRLVLGVLLLPPGHALVPGDDDGPWRVVHQELGHHRREAVDGVGRPPVCRCDRLGEGEERAVGKRVAVDQEELAVNWLG